jgi:DNA-binding NarL/FixJ family response regulator
MIISAVTDSSTPLGENMIRVLIVDDHAFIRAQVTAILQGVEGITVVGECADGTDVPSVADQVHPDVVVMDVHMPVTSGPAATVDLMARQPGTRVLMLTGTTSARAVSESARAGAAGLLLKGGAADQLIDAVRTVADGGTVWPAA